MVRVECSASRGFSFVYVDIFRTHYGVSVTHHDPDVGLDFPAVKSRNRWWKWTNRAEDSSIPTETERAEQPSGHRMLGKWNDWLLSWSRASTADSPFAGLGWPGRERERESEEKAEVKRPIPENYILVPQSSSCRPPHTLEFLDFAPSSLNYCTVAPWKFTLYQFEINIQSSIFVFNNCIIEC